MATNPRQFLGGLCDARLLDLSTEDIPVLTVLLWKHCQYSTDFINIGGVLADTPVRLWDRYNIALRERSENRLPTMSAHSTICPPVWNLNKTLVGTCCLLKILTHNLAWHWQTNISVAYRKNIGQLFDESNLYSFTQYILIYRAYMISNQITIITTKFPEEAWM